VQQSAIDGSLVELEQERLSHERAHRTRDLQPKSPYFGHLMLREERREREVLIGKGSAVDRRLPANIIDWRNAPISRLFYDYEEGEQYCEEIAGREREGEVTARRTLDIRGGVLQGVETRELVARKRAGNAWEVKRRADQVLERSDVRDDPPDHALPDIVALITRDQFGVMTRPESGVVVLRGQAGSGKTTVALHRIAFLRYQDPERFRLDRVLVVMFNKALQTYIRKALSDLEISGVQVATFHAWASRMLQAGGLSVRFRGGAPRESVALKQHPAIELLLAAQVRTLGSRLEAWLPVPEGSRAAWQATEGSGLSRINAFFHNRTPEERAELGPLRDRVWRRLRDHPRDLNAMLDDLDLARSVLPTSLHAQLPVAARHLRTRRDEGVFDFDDAALLLRIGQLVSAQVAHLDLPWVHRLAHIVVDEVQDLAAPAIRVLLDAADRGRSVTLAGDPAQTLYGAGGFGLLTGGAGQVDSALELDTLPVGHRSTRPIMALALRASGRQDPDLLALTRPGHAVCWLRGDQAGAAAVAGEIGAFLGRRPNALVAVLCHTRAAADTWTEQLAPLLPNVRRGHRDTFAFEPGTVVSNVHQVKGLEFDGVVLIEPGSYRERDRNLLHVAITRAADRLWVVCRNSAGLLADGP
jgi:DNA helicase-2/ATP-dependent DNA helicase PcrA